MRQPARNFWRGRTVLVTGHTGFKGAWLVLMLDHLGASVQGLALPPGEAPNAYALLGVSDLLAGEAMVDIRDAAATRAVIQGFRPHIVLHLAAEALVSRAYADPLGTFATNVQGTLNVLSALRGMGTKAIVAVTTDKVYRNDGAGRPFSEEDALGGNDPYSASKAACEIAVASFRASFADLPPTATTRAGNVVGGGDFAPERLIPDIIRAEMAGKRTLIRQPDATRPFQHVLDVLRGYLLLAEDLAAGHAPPAVNFGPEASLAVRQVLALAAEVGGHIAGWERPDGPTYAEAKALALDSALAHSRLRWEARLTGRNIFADTFDWYRRWRTGEDMAAFSRRSVEEALA